MSFFLAYRPGHHNGLATVSGHQAHHLDDPSVKGMVAMFAHLVRSMYRYLNSHHSTVSKHHKLCESNKLQCNPEIILSLVLICRQTTCDIAAGTAWDTVPIWEHTPLATTTITSLYVGKPAKLTWVQLRRHVSSKDLRWLLLLSATYILICRNSIPGSASGFVAGSSVALRTRL